VLHAKADNQFAEIGVVGYEDSLLAMCDCKHLGIHYARWIVSPGNRNIVPMGVHVFSDTEFDALIEQEPHHLRRSHECREHIFAMHNRVRILKASTNVITREPWVVQQELIDIWVLRELAQDQFDGYAGSTYDRFPCHNLGIHDNAVGQLVAHVYYS
jgi:hypothetical protein